MELFKRMMSADPAQRMALAEVAALGPMARASASMAADKDDKPRGRNDDGAGGGWRAGPALVDEEPGWIEHVLGE